MGEDYTKVRPPEERCADCRDRPNDADLWSFCVCPPKHVHYQRIFANGIAVLYCHFDGRPIAEHECDQCNADWRDLLEEGAENPRWARVVRRWEAKHT